MSEDVGAEQTAAVDLDPEDFTWYTDPEVSTVVGSFAFGAGIAERDVAAMGRQLAVELAEILRIREAFVTVPQFLAVREAALREPSAGRRPGPKPAFAVFRSLPETRIVRDAARRLGARLAVTGRLVGSGMDFRLGVNLFDVERLTLLGCVYRECERESLLEAVEDVGVYLLSRFMSVEEAALRSEIRDTLGTQSYRAFYHWSLASDMDRSAAMGIRELDPRRLIDRLRYCFGQEPGYGRALNRVVELFEEASERGDTDLLERIARDFQYVPLAHPTIALVRAEAFRHCGEGGEARGVLEDCMRRFPSHPQAYYLMGQLEMASGQPGAARGYFQQASEIDPGSAVFRAAFEAVREPRG